MRPPRTDDSANASTADVRRRSVLTAAQRLGFERDGFVAHPEPLTTRAELLHIRGVLDGLFHRAHLLPVGWHGDLGERPGGDGADEIPEILHPSRLAPELRSTHLFRNCHTIARELIGDDVQFDFDHAIYKPPHNQQVTHWHQDEAYAAAPGRRRLRAHVWVPLQDVDEAAGCLVYLPASHRGPLVVHQPTTSTGHALAAELADTSGGTACPLAAGGAVVHHPMTLHYAGRNTTDGVRRAWILQFAVKDPLERVRPAAVGARLRTAWVAYTARRALQAQRSVVG